MEYFYSDIQFYIKLRKKVFACFGPYILRRGGTTAALDGLNKYFGIAQMPVAGSTYWNMVHGLYGEEAPQDEEGMQTMRNLARNMIWMMRCFKLGRESGILYPETETDACTNFIKRSDTLR